MHLNLGLVELRFVQNETNSICADSAAEVRMHMLIFGRQGKYRANEHPLLPNEHWNSEKEGMGEVKGRVGRKWHKIDAARCLRIGTSVEIIHSIFPYYRQKVRVGHGYLGITNGSDV